MTLRELYIIVVVISDDYLMYGAIEEDEGRYIFEYARTYGRSIQIMESLPQE